MLRIYVDRLKDGHTETIEETLSPDLLEVKEKELQFAAPIRVSGKAYLAEDHLVIQLKINTEATMPCLICNGSVQKKVAIPSFYHTEEVGEIRGQIFDYLGPMRGAILLEVPNFVECMGSCPRRGELSSYLEKGETQFPFKDLEE